MPKLNNRHKLVLMNALKGMNQTDAYEAVYGHSSATYKCASELFNKPHFKAALERLQDKQLAEIQSTVLTRSEKRQILADIARAQLIDLLDDNGQPKLDKKSSAAKALKEWYYRQRLDRDGNPVVTRSAKLIDPIAAIIEDNKMVGDYAPSKHMVAQKTQVEVIFKRRNRHDELEQGEEQGEDGED